MALTARQRRHLRGLGHGLRPCVEVGAAGLAPGVRAELAQQLEHHELVKVRVRVGERARRDALIDELAAAVGAEQVSRIGHTVLLYRPQRAASGARPTGASGPAQT